MLPSNLNKFKEYLDNNTSYNYEDMGKILNILSDDNTRSQFYIAVSKVKQITNDYQPQVEVKEYITTSSIYIEEKIVITGYYENHVQHYLLGKCMQKLKQKDKKDTFVFREEYRIPTGNENSRSTKISS